MMNQNIPLERGRWIGLSKPRKFVGDLLAAARRIPSIPMQRTMQLHEVIAARANCPQRISWCAIFLKAYSIISARRPELRRTYLSWPWPHLYEHPSNVASFSLERRYQNEDAVFIARIAKPEELSLAELDQIVRYHKTADIDSVLCFRQALLLSSLPRPLRRLIWWLGLNTDGMKKAYFFGTFAISVVASLGAAGLHLLSPLTTTLNYGVFAEDGSIDVRLTYDHRVLDGATVARALVELEDELRSTMVQELQALSAAETPRLRVA